MVSSMNFEHDLTSLKQRIAKAERSRDAWRAAGVAGEEHYLEACTTISALTLQMDKLYETPPSAAERLPSPSAGYR